MTMSKNNVLVVDDDKDILGVLDILLTSSGFNVVAISRGEEVESQLTEHKPDVILLDINLGTMDGRDICKNIKDNKETKEIPIVMFSANHNMRNQLCPCTADNFIEKPFEMHHLVNTLKSLCN
jgi:DNA-binding response OmpR family regulator